jgi:hypothetical protein
MDAALDLKSVLLSRSGFDACTVLPYVNILFT